MQGAEITKEGVKEALLFEAPGLADDPIKAEALAATVANTSYAKCLKFLLEKIESADEAWLKKFVLAITGRPTLLQNSTIKIKESHREVFEIHTCTSSLDIPKNLPDDGALRELFLSSLEAAISDSSTYNIA